ncbi:MAG: aspartate ammonia-lyase [Elusimicrobia bacterium RIFOXYB2_FULL_50_12]|nr:MAG: aspartate ammonia-lyase [Elusimicrobia bacterium RIFOXYB2_FULL_50_12]
MKTIKLSTNLSGVSGEYLAAGELSRRGYIAALTSRSAKGIDILASNETATKSIGIQVKTNQGDSRKWMLRNKAENYFADNLFYILVNLNNGANPEYYIVPSKIVAEHISKSHKKWLNTLGVKGQKHNDNPIRWFVDEEHNYLNRWDLLGL